MLHSIHQKTTLVKRSIQMKTKAFNKYLLSLLFLLLSEQLNSLHLLLQQTRQPNVQVSYVFNFCKK